MLAGGGEQLGVAAEGERDPVGDLEAGLLAGVLDGVDDLAGEALAAQLVVELELERDGVARLRLDLVALERLQGEGDVVGAEGVVGRRRSRCRPRRRRARRATWAASSARPPAPPAASPCRSADRGSGSWASRS